MQPEIPLGPITLQTFGLMFALGFIAAGVVIAKRFTELGKPPDWAYEMAFSALLGGIVGSRLYYMSTTRTRSTTTCSATSSPARASPGTAASSAARSPSVSGPGTANFLSLQLLDVAAVPLALGYAIGRIGCQLSGDGDYGKPWDGPWAMTYPDGTVPTTEEVHPTPVYETLAMGLGAWILWRLRDRFRVGILFALYLIYAGAERFLVEFIRRNDDAPLGLTQAQLESLAMIAAGLIWIFVVRRRHGTLARPAGDTAPPQPVAA